jgi:diguanylate cyclase (GGDEF)-like protein
MVQGLLAREAKLKSTMEKLENAARRDGLTEIWNRRYFMELGHRELVRTSREKTYISLIYFDLDHFKSINDTYGHAAGDKVLMTLAQVVSSELRELDVFGRMGGEEFAVLLPGTNTEGAFSVAEKLRAAIEKQQIAHQEATLRCTASFGLTAKNGNKIEIDDFIKKADKAMYRAKVQGRNRIVVD